MNEIAFIIRFCYPTSYPEDARQWRFTWFREECLPRILAQTYSGFDIWMWVSEAHRAEVEAMSPRIRTFTVGTGMLRPETAYPWAAVHGLPRYPIQVRMDSDDLITPDFLRRAVDELATMRKRRALVWFQPYKVAAHGQDVYWCAPAAGKGAYGPNKISAFCVFRQPTVGRYTWLYSRGHIRLGELADEIRGVEAGYCWATCHNFNDSTQIYDYDVPLPDAPKPWP